MGKLAIEAICNSITNDALKKADNILNDAKLKAGIILEEAQKNADEYGKKIINQAKERYEAEKRRIISAENMSVKSKILFAKQELIENILSSAKTHIENLDDEKYKKLLISLISKSATELESLDAVKVILPQRAKRLLSEREIKKAILEKKLLSAEYSNGLTSGVIIISKNIEISNSISDIIREKKDSLSDLICSMLFKEE